MKKIISRCGSLCSECKYRVKFNCPTCHKSNGKQFWGNCDVAKCSIGKRIHDCSVCDDFACSILKEYSYDKEQGDNGKRIENLKSIKNKINTFIKDLEVIDPKKNKIVKQLRKIFNIKYPELGERFIYGGIGFYHNNELIGGIFVSKKHVSLTFSNGAQFKDPKKSLDGTGKYRRFLKIVDFKDIKIKEVGYFIDQAVSCEKKKKS
jgi:hypothetical protein